MRRVIAALLALAGVFHIRAAERPTELSSEVRAIFQAKCHGCHGAAAQMNGLRLDLRDAALKGGSSGPVILPGNSAQSKLILRVASRKDGFRMPLEGAPLTKKEVGILRDWIDQGAHWASGNAISHWSFQPIRRHQPPAARNPQWVSNPIDAFVLGRLEKEGMVPSPEADKGTLVRRLSLDLTGLPPSPAETDAFVSDPSPRAYERLVDRLLRSPHYGERWARPWLDLARYADSDGYEKDNFRPYAWRWRHWVIEALNRDLPFDQFTIEQIAGDLLPNATLEQRVATGFHRNALKNREAGVKRDEARFEEVVDWTNTVGTTWLGLTIGCAQCHDHKYDPILQKDYYQLFAFFHRAEEAQIDAPLPGELGTYWRARPSYEAKRRALIEQAGVPPLQPSWEARMARTMDNPGQDLDWDYAVTELRARLDHGERLLRKGASRRAERENRRLTDYFILDPGPEYSRDSLVSEKFTKLRVALRELDRSSPALTQAPVIVESAEPVKTHLAVRGDYRQNGPEVQPDTPAFLPRPPPSGEPPRLRLARWLVSPENPLTARVAVNRIWQELFGTGLVRTSEDFGAQGEPASHPELLDWLAWEFMDRGWSVKQIQKLIVMSSTYRQGSRARQDLQDRDPDNRLLARQSRLRLNAEQVRDAALAASGLLYPAVGGKSVRPPQPESVSKITYSRGASWEETDGPERYRRGIYVHYQRTSPYPLMVNFDASDSNTSCSRRRRSNSPLQALNLLNDPVFFEAAQALAARVLEEAPANWNSRLAYLFRVSLGRKADAVEQDRVATLFERQKRIFERDLESAQQVAPNAAGTVSQAEMAALTAAGRAVMNLDEFITRE